MILHNTITTRCKRVQQFNKVRTVYEEMVKDQLNAEYDTMNTLMNNVFWPEYSQKSGEESGGQDGGGEADSKRERDVSVWNLLLDAGCFCQVGQRTCYLKAQRRWHAIGLFSLALIGLHFNKFPERMNQTRRDVIIGCNEFSRAALFRCLRQLLHSHGNVIGPANGRRQ